MNSCVEGQPLNGDCNHAELEAAEGELVQAQVIQAADNLETP